MAERRLAKAEVASSSLVTCSKRSSSLNKVAVENISDAHWTKSGVSLVWLREPNNRRCLVVTFFIALNSLHSYHPTKVVYDILVLMSHRFVDARICFLSSEVG